MSENAENGPREDAPEEPTDRGGSLRLFGIVAVGLLLILLLVFLATR